MAGTPKRKAVHVAMTILEAGYHGQRMYQI